ncbi:hypothetical protein DFH07DRAFT_1059878 [Mycena maculata]|uniref:Uncharacterized protein n=1 Tax=Mycena maculata TaxID=230809 RepID=A0AAD7NIC1_9AGAR|nr:hypothetical protein DFH07DRAFT_1059878 [Mycena maculata]
MPHISILPGSLTSSQLILRSRQPLDTFRLPLDFRIRIGPSFQVQTSRIHRRVCHHAQSHALAFPRTSWATSGGSRPSNDAHLFASPLFLRTQRPPLQNPAVVPFLRGHAQLDDPSSTMRRQGLEPHRRRIYTGFMKWPGTPSSNCIDGSRSYRPAWPGCVHCGFDLVRCSHRVSCLNVFAGSR